jgi:hypothetical protein
MDITDRYMFEAGDLGHVVSRQDQGQGSSVLGGNALCRRPAWGVPGALGDGRFGRVYELTPPRGVRLRGSACLPPPRGHLVGDFMLGRIRSQADDPPQSQNLAPVRIADRGCGV